MMCDGINSSGALKAKLIEFFVWLSIKIDMGMRDN